MSFYDKWKKAVESKNSILCAGLDPAECTMGRKEEGLREGTSKLEWALKYVTAVAPYCAAVKPNVNYWKEHDDMRSLREIVDLAHSQGLVVIDDSKLADIGDTNDAGIYHSKSKGFDAVTIAPFAGNLAQAAQQAKARDIGAITMCLMSNPEYEREKNKLVPVSDALFTLMMTLTSNPGKVIDGQTYLYQYIYLAYESTLHHIDGIVIGAPSPKNHIKENEIKKVRDLVNSTTLVLLPGIGKQGGEAGTIMRYFDRENVIANVGRDLMFPNGSNTTPEQQAERAQYYQKMLNDL